MRTMEWIVQICRSRQDGASGEGKNLYAVGLLKTQLHSTGGFVHNPLLPITQCINHNNNASH